MLRIDNTWPDQMVFVNDIGTRLPYFDNRSNVSSIIYYEIFIPSNEQLMDISYTNTEREKAKNRLLANFTLRDGTRLSKLTTES